MNKTCLIFCLLVLSSIRLLAQQTEGVVDNGTYIDDRLGWTFKIPENFSSVSKESRIEDTQAAIKKLKANTVSNGSVLLLSFKKNGATTEPKFLSGLQNKSAIGVPIATEADFINYISNVLKRSSQKVEINTFKKKIGLKEYYGYQLTFANNLKQRGLIKIIGNWIFYQTWIFDNEDDAKIIEAAIYSAKLR
ncbi:hypothetical protein [Mucilaginibacter sp. UYCu711]|uniref:hypothetical protein n=1 Tax=Mucilaginibacter sp. UYCu711 TaxID=3156339 RepID=UPI003D1BD340